MVKVIGQSSRYTWEKSREENILAVHAPDEVRQRLKSWQT